MLAFKNPLYSVESVRMVAREIVTLGECKELGRKLGREKKAIFLVNSEQVKKKDVESKLMSGDICPINIISVWEIPGL